MNRQLVFVYGTLRQGGPLHEQLGPDAVLVDDGAVIHEYTLYLYPKSMVPVMVRAAGKHVEGELYAVDWKDISRLDKIEGEGKLYYRHSVTLCNGLRAWAYVWGHGVNGMTPIGANYLTGAVDEQTEGEGPGDPGASDAHGSAAEEERGQGVVEGNRAEGGEGDTGARGALAGEEHAEPGSLAGHG